MFTTDELLLLYEQEDNWDSGESELATSPRKDDISESIEIEKVSAANKVYLSLFG